MKVFNMSKFTSLLASLVLVFVPIALVQAEDAKREIGVVTCDYIPGTKVNFIIHSSASFDC